ncbi:hypothetical protein ACFWN1_17905 [Streptomyces sp. NPDC058459]|uniref:hypothetical protein n=1 Tax=Streptomyces sp. NPDC058459 TaxID=3346508 RepID=UPI00364E432C
MAHHTAAPTTPLLPPLLGPARRREEPEPPDTVTAWLAGAHPQPERVLRHWDEGHDELMPLGGRFAAVRVPGHIMHTAAGDASPEAVAALARDILRGPLITGMYAEQRTYWALVPSRAHVYWPSYLTDTPHLGTGSYLNMPPPSCTTPPTEAELPTPYWVTSPRYRYDLCSREQVFNVIIRVTSRDGGTT